MTHYRMTYRDVLNLPITVFWLLNRYISPIQAEQDVRNLRVVNGAQMTGEGVKELFEMLNVEMGKPIVVKPQLDRRGLEELRAMC